MRNRFAGRAAKVRSDQYIWPRVSGDALADATKTNDAKPFPLELCATVALRLRRASKDPFLLTRSL